MPSEVHKSQSHPRVPSEEGNLSQILSCQRSCDISKSKLLVSVRQVLSISLKWVRANSRTDEYEKSLRSQQNTWHYIWNT